MDNFDGSLLTIFSCLRPCFEQTLYDLISSSVSDNGADCDSTNADADSLCSF